MYHHARDFPSFLVYDRLLHHTDPFVEELSGSNQSFLRLAKMAALPPPSPTCSEISICESALGGEAEDTVKSSGILFSVLFLEVTSQSSWELARNFFSTNLIT